MQLPKFIRSLNEAYPEPRGEMHGITDNMPVRVTSRRGEIVFRCTVTEKTTVGVVFIPLAWRYRATREGVGGS